MHDPLARRAGVSFLLLLVFAAAYIPPCVSADPLTVSLFSPYPTGVTVTSGPVTLAVIYRNGSAGPPVRDVHTEFYVEVPGSTSFAMVGDAYSGSDGHASLTFSPPFAGSYQWYVKGYGWQDVTSDTWTFSCAIPTTTLTQTSTTTYTAVPTTTTTHTTIQTTTSTQWTTTHTTIPTTTSTQWTTTIYTTIPTTTSTQWTTTHTTVPTTTLTQWTTATCTRTVGVVTVSSYVYATATSATTAYRTQTVSTTRTTSVPTTLTKTSTAFATTQTTPVIYYETQSTTLTEMSYATISVTQYVYVESYISSQVIEYATIQQISNGSEGSVHFSKGDEHKIQTITIGVVGNATDVKIAIATAPDHTNVGTNATEYGSFELAATNLSDDIIKSVVIEFEVDRNWLSSNQIPQDRVTLYRYENGEWRGLETSLLRTDEKYAYYKAVSPGLSIFAIAGQSSSFFQIPGIGPIVGSYALILPIIIIGILGAYGAIRITNSRRKSGKAENDLAPPPAERSSEDQIDAKLLEYITRQGGSISLSKAVEDLGAPPATIEEAISRLKNEGKLTPA